MSTVRKVTKVMLAAKCCLYSQWFKGDKNDVADACTRDFHLSDTELTYPIISSIPNQVPCAFHLKPLWEEINYWLISLLQKQPEVTQSLKWPLRSKLMLGDIGENISPPSVFQTTCSLTNLLTKTSIKFLGVLLKQCRRDGSVKLDLDSYKNPLSIPPWTTWHRPSGLTTGMIQELTSQENWLTFYTTNSKDIKISTLGWNSKKPSLHPSFVTCAH